MIIMKIYTKTGDDGYLQSSVVLANSLDNDISEILTDVQNDLFLVGADLSNPNPNYSKNKVSLEMIEKLESLIDKFESELPPLTNFILPGGVPAASQIHYVRAVVRRAETLVVNLSEKDEINPNCIKYLNRLSDFLFVLGCLINKRSNREDILWKI